MDIITKASFSYENYPYMLVEIVFISSVIINKNGCYKAYSKIVSILNVQMLTVSVKTSIVDPEMIANVSGGRYQ